MMESMIRMLSCEALRNLELVAVPSGGLFDIYAANGDGCFVMGCTEEEASYIVNDHNDRIGR